eukprot:1157486-Pelagomonas_calceolata.AAC.4
MLTQVAVPCEIFGSASRWLLPDMQVDLKFLGEEEQPAKADLQSMNLSLMGKGVQGCSRCTLIPPAQRRLQVICWLETPLGWESLRGSSASSILGITGFFQSVHGQRRLDEARGGQSFSCLQHLYPPSLHHQ